TKHLLRIEDLHHSFETEEVLKGISLALDKGETKVIVGPSGTGKSTILNNIIRLVPPTKGKIYLEDTEITTTKKINEIRQQ
ncbi:MAG: ATP-binding cassette domain-containing protein, partial [Halanaerobium sp.]